MWIDCWPLAIFVCFPRSFDRFIDIRLVAFGDQCKDFFVCRIYGFEGLTGLRRDPLASDQKALRSSQEVEHFCRSYTMCCSFNRGTTAAILFSYLTSPGLILIGDFSFRTASFSFFAFAQFAPHEGSRPRRCSPPGFAIDASRAHPRNC